MWKKFIVLGLVMLLGCSQRGAEITPDPTIPRKEKEKDTKSIKTVRPN
jgi:hypothetical protein